MFSWCKQTILLVALIYFYGGKVLPSLAEKAELKSTVLSYSNLQINYQDNNRSAWENTGCQDSNIAYKKLYSFATESYYISICQLENDYYYHRQSKLNPANSLFIPATPVLRGDVFQATNGKTTYFVGKDSERYYSSVMLNNNEIVFEPELVQKPIAFAQDVVEGEVDFSFSDIRLSSINIAKNAGWEIGLSETEPNSNRALICTTDKSILNPNLNDWHNLLGKSTDIADKYATTNGHSFVYDRSFPDKASIETKEGTIVDLNIATTSAIIDRICVQSIEDS